MRISLLLLLLVLAGAAGLWDRSIKESEADSVVTAKERFRRAQEKVHLSKSIEAFAATNFSGSNALSAAIASGANKVSSMAARQRDEALIRILQENVRQEMRELSHVLALYGSQSDAVGARKVLEGGGIKSGFRRIGGSGEAAIFRVQIDPNDVGKISAEVVASLEALKPLKAVNLSR